MEESGFGDDYYEDDYSDDYSDYYSDNDSDDDSDDDYSDYSDYFTFYSVWPNPTVREDCAASSAPSQPHVHVRFSHRTADDFDDTVGYGEESRTICLSDDLLAERLTGFQEINSQNFIFFEGLRFWPLVDDTVLDIAEEVIDKAREYKCTIQVDMRTVYMPGFDDQETYEDDRDLGEAVEGVNGAAVASDGGFQVKSLKRKRIECGGNRCVICLEELTEGTDAAVMPCSHNLFHDDCLSSWVEISPSCPLCRRKMSAPAAAAAADSRP